MNALLDPLATRLGLEFVPLCQTLTTAGASVSNEEFSRFVRLLNETLECAEPLDALLVHASGTLVVNGTSGESLLLQHLRQRNPTRLIALLVDHVAQFPPYVTEFTPLIVGPHHWPAYDRLSRLERVAQLLAQWASGDITPIVTVRQLPLILPLAFQRTDVPPFNRLPSLLTRLEAQSNVLAVSVLGGFPYADVRYGGASVVVVTNGDAPLGRTLAHELGQRLVQLCHLTTWPSLTIEEAIHHAMAASRHPVVILDTGDAPEAGAPGEGTAALWAALDLGARGALVSGIVDPEAVEFALRAGPGATIELELGAKTDHRHGYPIPVRGIVRRIGSGLYRRRSPLCPGQPIDAGPSVWLELVGRYDARIDVVVTSRPVPFDDPGLPLSLGLRPQDAWLIVLKSAVDSLAWCKDGTNGAPDRPCAEVVQALTPGISATDLSFFAFQELPRPLWPLDPL